MESGGSLNPSTPARPLEDGIVDMGPAFEENTLLGTMNDARLRVRQPFQVTMATENDDFIAEAEEIDEFGLWEEPFRGGSRPAVDDRRTLLHAQERGASSRARSQARFQRA